MTCCQSCGVEAPTKYVEFYQNIGALVMRFSKSVKGNLCSRCISQHFWSLTLMTLFLGWWGMVSLIITPFILLNNVFRYLSALGLQSPPPNAVAPRLTDDVLAKLEPYTMELVNSVQAGTPVDQVVTAIARKSNTTPGQTRLFVDALVRATKQSK